VGGYFFLFEELIVNIITVNAVRKIPICVKSLKVMYISYTPFQMFSHLGRCIDRLSSEEPSSLLYHIFHLKSTAVLRHGGCVLLQNGHKFSSRFIDLL